MTSGVFIVLFFSDPMVNILNELGTRTGPLPPLSTPLSTAYLSPLNIDPHLAPLSIDPHLALNSICGSERKAWLGM